jgi:capsular polysaccharide transport system permease protein
MSLARGALVQFQVVHALVLRETRTRFGANQLGYLWAVLEPLMWVGTFWATYVLANRKVPADMGVVAFLGTGIVTYSMFQNTAVRSGEAINGNRGLLFYPQVQPLDLIFARGALEIATYCAVFLLIMGGNAMGEQELPRVDDILYVMLGLGLAALLGAGLGLVLCMLGEISNMVQRLRGPLMRPLFWMPGLFFTLEDAPEGARKYLLFNPVLHVVEIVRDGWFPSYDSPSADPGYVAYWILGLVLAGLLLERVVRRRIELS